MKKLQTPNNKKGIIYTPHKLAMQMVELLAPKINETIKDISVGEGALSLALLEYIANKYDPTATQMKDYVENNLFMSDIDLYALKITERKIDH